MSIIVRGTSITVTAEFFDEAGVSAVPVNPILYHQYEQGGVEVTGEAVMVENAGEWSATIDTSSADDGMLFWSIRADGVAKDGNVRLVANPANPEIS